MSQSQRLSRLEASLTATPTDQGSYCRRCGGITIEDAIRDASILNDVVSYHCRRCEEPTLAGALRDMLAADEQK